MLENARGSMYSTSSTRKSHTRFYKVVVLAKYYEIYVE